MPIRVTITPGQWGDSPQARGLIDGLSGVGRVIMDAAYDADHLRDFIASGLTPYEYICKIWTTEPERFNLDPTHQMPGLNT